MKRAADYLVIRGFKQITDHYPVGGFPGLGSLLSTTFPAPYHNVSSVLVQPRCMSVDLFEASGHQQLAPVYFGERNLMFEPVQSAFAQLQSCKMETITVFAFSNKMARTNCC
jgi:hypothetical protein